VITDYDRSTQTGTDRFVFTDASLSDVTISREENDLIIELTASSEAVEINRFFDTNHDYAIEELQFSDGTVYSSSDLFAAVIQDDELVLV